MQRRVDPRLLQLAPLFDALALVLAGVAAWWLRFGRPVLDSHYLLALLLAFLLALVLLPLAGSYRHPLWSHPLRGVIAAMPGLVLLLGALMLTATLTKSTAHFSRLWMVAWALFGVAGMSVWRLVLARVSAVSARRVLLLGTGQLACSTTQHLQASLGPESVIGMLLLPGEKPAEDAPLPAPLLGELKDLERIVTDPDQAIQELWLAPDAALGAIDPTLQAGLQQSSLPVRYVPDLSVLRLLQHRASEVEGLTVIELNATPLDGPEALIKIVLDKALSTLALLLFSPLLLMLAALIRLDSPGPALFAQRRHGGGGRIIHVFKFRTMREDGQTDAQQAQRNDPRITRVGAFLRRTSLDELPQLLNVLRGDMSLVGPRPHPLALNSEYRDQLDTYMRRHRVKPGITGWAQINGYRGETNTLEKMQKRLEYDLYYIEHWSLWLDIRILAKTALFGWSNRNAY